MGWPARACASRSRAAWPLIAARAPTALETIDATVKRSKVSADAPAESPSDHRVLWEVQREVVASDAAFLSVGGAAFGMSSAMAPPLAEGVPAPPPLG